MQFQKQNKWSDEQVVQDYITGIELDELYLKYDISQTSLYRLLQKFSVPLRAAKSLTEQQIEDLKKAYESGVSYSGLCHEFGIGKSLIGKLKIQHQWIRPKILKTDLIDFESARQMYEDQFLSLSEIGEKFNVSKRTIATLFQKHGLKLRTSGETQRGIVVKEEQLCKDYQEGMTYADMQQKYEISVVAISKIIKNHNIVLRGHEKVDEEPILKEYALDSNMTHVAIKLNISIGAVRDCLIRNGVEIKQNVPAGENHHNWKGGVTPEVDKIRRSEEYKIWRRVVQTRDQWTCQLCEKKGGKIHVHHIIPIYKDISLIMVVENGITLCNACHESLSRNEEQFISEFQRIVKKDFDVEKCKDEILLKIQRRRQTAEEKQERIRERLERSQILHTSVNQEELKRLYLDEKLSMKEVSQRMNLPVWLIQFKIHEWDMKKTREEIHRVRGLKSRIQVDLDKMKELYLSGLSSLTVSSMMGISSGYVAQKVNEMGIARSQSEAQRNRFDKESKGFS